VYLLLDHHADINFKDEVKYFSSKYQKCTTNKHEPVTNSATDKAEAVEVKFLIG
jgi:hypothetical protein